MAILVWAVESVLMGLWGTVLAGIFSTPFHRFLAVSHLIVSSATAVIQLLIVSRNPSRAFPVAQAFHCAVMALVLVYVAVLLHPPSYDAAFASPDAGTLPLAACVGLAWLLATLLSATGMALGDSSQKSTLFLHPFGYHLPALLPCVFITVMHGSTWLVVIELIIWAVYVGLNLYASMISGGVISDTRKNNAGFFSCCSGMTYTEIVAFFVKGIGRVAGLAVPVLMWLVCDKTPEVNVLALTGLVIAGMNFLTWASFLDWLLGEYTITALTKVSVADGAKAQFRDNTIITPLRWRDKMI